MVIVQVHCCYCQSESMLLASALKDASSTSLNRDQNFKLKTDLNYQLRLRLIGFPVMTLSSIKGKCWGAL